jgi:hypothetical protein
MNVNFYLALKPCFADQEVDAKLAEMDLIAADLERANSRVAAVERRNVRPRLMANLVC